jgi:uncharacterized protein YciI
MITAVICATILMGSQDFPSFPALSEKRFFILLNKGAKRAMTSTMPEKEVNAMQAKHLANFGRLDGIGKLIFVGPLGDNGFIRGIIAVKARSRAEFKELFAPDPYIEHGILDIDSYEMSKANWESIDFAAATKMVSNTLVILKQGPNWTRSKSTGKFGLLPSEANWIKSGKLIFWSRLAGGTDKTIVGLLYFQSTKLPEVAEWVKSDPLIINGVLTAEPHPQFMAGRFKSLSP